MAGTLPIEWLTPRLVNAFALRRADSEFSSETLQTASRTAWVSDAVLRGSVAVFIIATLVVIGEPPLLQRIGLTAVAIMIFIGCLNVILGPRLGREIDAGGSNLDRQIALNAIQGAIAEGIRPREWDHSLIQKCLEPADASFWEVQGLLFAYYHALDSREYIEAEKFIRRATEIIQPTHAPLPGDVWHEAAFVVARFHRDPEVARGCLRFLRSKGTTHAHTRHRVEAAVFLAEGRTNEAKHCAELGIGALITPRNAAFAQLDEDLLRQILDEVDT